MECEKNYNIFKLPKCKNDEVQHKQVVVRYTTNWNSNWNSRVTVSYQKYLHYRVRRYIFP